MAGKKERDKNPRTLVDHSLGYISAFRPVAGMRENVKGLTSMHKATLDRITHSLHKTSGHR